MTFQAYQKFCQLHQHAYIAVCPQCFAEEKACMEHDRDLFEQRREEEKDYFGDNRED